MKKGDILIAKNVCKMYSGEHALIKGKEYQIIDVFRDNLVIKSEVDRNHYFSLYPDRKDEYYGTYFKKPKKP